MWMTGELSRKSNTWGRRQRRACTSALKCARLASRTRYQRPPSLTSTCRVCRSTVPPRRRMASAYTRRFEEPVRMRLLSRSRRSERSPRPADSMSQKRNPETSATTTRPAIASRRIQVTRRERRGAVAAASAPVSVCLRLPNMSVRLPQAQVPVDTLLAQRGIDLELVIQTIPQIEAHGTHRGAQAHAAAHTPAIIVAVDRLLAGEEIVPLEFARPRPHVAAVQEHGRSEDRVQREAHLDVGEDEHQASGSAGAQNALLLIAAHRGGAARRVEVVDRHLAQGELPPLPQGGDSAQGDAGGEGPALSRRQVSGRAHRALGELPLATQESAGQFPHRVIELALVGIEIVVATIVNPGSADPARGELRLVEAHQLRIGQIGIGDGDRPLLVEAQGPGGEAAQLAGGRGAEAPPALRKWLFLERLLALVEVRSGRSGDTKPEEPGLGVDHRVVEALQGSEGNLRLHPKPSVLAPEVVVTPVGQEPEPVGRAHADAALHRAVLALAHANLKRHQGGVGIDPRRLEIDELEERRLVEALARALQAIAIEGIAGLEQELAAHHVGVDVGHSLDAGLAHVIARPL